MKNISVFLTVVLLGAFFSYTGYAQQAVKPAALRTISYQGQLLDASKLPVMGSHRVSVRLYDAPIEGSLLHAETFTSDFANGIFSVIIGSQQPIETAIRFDKQYWVGVSIDDAAELSPRTELTSVPYAIHADIANSLAKGAAGAVTSINGRSGDFTIKGGPGTFVQADGNTITISSIQSGSLGNQQTQQTFVNSLTGTTNQITASSLTGNVTLSLPQDIHNAASPKFAGMSLTNFATAGIVHNNSLGALSNSLLVDADVSSGAAIADTKLATISTSGKVANSATSANSTNTANSIVLRDGSGNFSAGTITAGLSGNATNVNGTISETHGGTNNTSYIKGDVLYASALNTLSKLPIGTTGNILTVAAGIPTWSAPAVTVTSAQGTANRILVNGDLLSHTGAVTVSTVQDIGTSSTPSFAGLSLSGKASSASTLVSDPANCLTTKSYVDNTTASAWNINGNSGIVSGNFIGTSDASNLSIRTNGIERMQLTSDGSLLLSGNSGAVPATGAGTRMMWIPSLGAFRTGKASGSEWNSGSVGSQSVAMGYGTLASGAQSVAMGFFTSAYGMGSTAIGSGAASYVDGATALGNGVQAVGYNSVAMGDNTTAWGDGSTALGSNTNSYGIYSTAMGYNTMTTTNYGTSMGKNLTVGLSSFGFNGSTTNTTVNVSAMSNVAYFGDVDMIIGNDDNTERSLRFYGKNSAATLTSKYTAFKAGTQAANITYTLPISQGGTGSVLTNNGSGTLSWVSPSITAYGTVSAGAAITIPGNTSVIKISADADSTANSITLPSGTNGQIMYIYNNDSEPTSGDAVINAGATGIFIYADGWRKTN